LTATGWRVSGGKGHGPSPGIVLSEFFPKKFNLLVDNKWHLIIFNCMVECTNNKNLSTILKAVSDTTRRSLLTQLCQQGTSRVTDLADLYDMSLNAVSKHIKVLEKAGLVTRRTIGRTHWIEPKIERVRLVENWFKELKSIWELRLEKLDEILKNGGIKNDRS
jgi:DNA-binding transcriptional ArsR family regulator